MVSTAAGRRMRISTHQQSQAGRLGEVAHLYPVSDAVGGGACGVLQTDDGRHHHVVRAAHQGSHQSEAAVPLQPEAAASLQPEAAASLQPDSVLGTLAMQQSAGKPVRAGA